ncbi:hypothetical protein, partial [Streptomonospora nanhaiensis]|uniref:hypothetical protein n=1 Tax=Streptomonospora nanhaiensis TaxID=1323731 RepID=UPI001C3838C5
MTAQAGVARHWTRVSLEHGGRFVPPPMGVGTRTTLRRKAARGGVVADKVRLRGGRIRVVERTKIVDLAVCRAPDSVKTQQSGNAEIDPPRGGRAFAGLPIEWVRGLYPVSGCFLRTQQRVYDILCAMFV